MAKKEWTPEERKAFGEKMKAAKAAKKAEQETPVADVPNAPATSSTSYSHYYTTTSTAAPSSDQSVYKSEPDPVAPQVNPVDVQELLNRINELERRQFFANMPQMGPMVTNTGIVGTLEKYRLDPEYYPDPCARLADEERLAPVAFKHNFELSYEVSTSAYETKDGRNVKEPKFTIELTRIIRDPETGEATNGRYVVCRGIFHEDPAAALVVAREHGVEVADENEKAFLDEMRYLRFRDWLLEAFYPPKSVQQKTNKRETVIDGKLVEFFEINSEQSETMPFNQITKKL